ncbi:nucleotide exchange factor GrpE [Candidatus Uhrbacteria bacterium]|nr:nucleotide exchange factor GrpE [Candidatus Uhrbacteria bacterium]
MPDEMLNSQDACAKCEEYLNGWKRALADYDNLKKDLATERVTMRAAALEDLAHRLIPGLDHFDQALKCKPDDLPQTAEPWAQGLLHVRTELESVMRELGAEPFGQVGEAFDPHIHEAIADQSSRDHDAGSVVEVVERGWKRGNRLIRPAKVIVSS